MKRADIKEGRYYATTSNDIFSGYGSLGIVEVVAVGARFERSDYDLGRLEDGKYKGALKNTIPLELRFPTADETGRKTGGDGILCKVWPRRESDAKWQYKLLRTRDIKMTEAEYLVKKEHHDEQVAESQRLAAIREQEFKDERAACSAKLDSLGVKYSEGWRTEHEGEDIGAIEVPYYTSDKRIKMSMPAFLTLLERAGRLTHTPIEELDAELTFKEDTA